MVSNTIVDQILTTRGVNSQVFLPGDLQRFTTVGHVGLFDFDGVSKRHVLDTCMDIEGISIMWESSKTGYHVWNLTIRSVDDTALLGLKLGEDSKHCQHGFNMGKWVLRIAPKISNDNEPYKPAPKFLYTWCNDSARCQSKAHFKLFAALTGKTILHKTKYDWRGMCAEVEDYMTITDTMKEGLK